MAKLYFKYGAMGSSKTAQALTTKFNYEERGMRVWLVKPSVDNRDGATTVRSRIGLSEEAYLATRKRERADNRSHLYPSPTVASFESGAVPEADMRAAREIFGDISDREIRKLYKKVTR